MMNKKAVISIAVILAVVLAVGGFVFTRINSKQEQQPIIDTTKPTTTTEKAEEFNEYIENMDTQEIEDTLNEKPTDAQKDGFDHAIGEIAVPEINSEITVDENGVAHYTDTEGNAVEVGLDETVINKTEEELEDDYDRMLEELRGYQVGGTTENQGNQGNQGNNETQGTQGTTSTPGSTGTNNNSTGNNIDAGDDISPEEAAEARRKAEEEFIKNGGTLTTDQREGTISDSEREYIGTHLRPAN